MFSAPTKYFVTPVLPYASDGSIDEQQYRSLLRRFLEPKYVEGGLAIIANPEAGEIFYLDRAEKKRVVQIAVEESAGRVPVFAGAIDNTTAGTVLVAKDAAEAGADGLFVLPPFGALDVATAWDANSYPEVFVDLLQAITQSVQLPMIVHPSASATPGYGVGIPAEATRWIIQAVPEIVGWKMTYSYDGYRKITRILRSLDRPVSIFGAAAEYFQENLATGAFDGTVSGSWNYALEAMFEHISAWARGDVEVATRVWEGGLAQLHEYVYSEYSRLHIRYKIACWLRGWIDSPLMREPLPKPRQKEINTLVVLLSEAGLSVRASTDIDAYVASVQKP